MPAVPSARRERAGYAIAAVLLFAAFFALGRYVTRAAEPVSFVSLEAALLNHSTLIAWWFTWLGLPYVLAPVCIALIVVAIVKPQWRLRVGFSILILLVCWQGSDLFQHFFARPRRLDWVVKHETAFSYPSSHAAIAVGFYMLWASIVRRSELPLGLRRWLPVLVDALAVGILWSRLALGAHYLTDVVGGALWALTAICAGVAAASTKVLSPPKGRP